MKAAVFLWLQNVQNQVKLYTFLMLVDEDEKYQNTKNKSQYKFLYPRWGRIKFVIAAKPIYEWPPQPQALMVNQFTYDIVAAPLAEIRMVTDRVLKVWSAKVFH